jgi:hypothetical protein
MPDHPLTQKLESCPPSIENCDWIPFPKFRGQDPLAEIIRKVQIWKHYETPEFSSRDGLDPETARNSPMFPNALRHWRS